MFCKYCGKEITDDSVFCSHCGKSQNSSNKTLANKPVWIVYIIWAMSNFYLLMGEKYNGTECYFFPYTPYGLEWDKYYYNFYEFIFYVFFFPAVLYVIYKRYHVKIDKIISKILNK